MIPVVFGRVCAGACSGYVVFADGTSVSGAGAGRVGERADVLMSVTVLIGDV